MLLRGYDMPRKDVNSVTNVSHAWSKAVQTTIQSQPESVSNDESCQHVMPLGKAT